MRAEHRITRVSKTNQSSPAEWVGLTNEGRGVYARYAGGELTIYLGHPDDGPELTEANGRLILLKVVALDDPGAGAMGLDELRRHTAGFIEWPAGETPRQEED